MRWIVLWVVGAVVLIFGVATLYFGPAWFVGGKGGGFYLPPQTWPVSLIIGLVGLIGGTIGTLRTLARPPLPKGRVRFANAAPPVGLIAAIAASVAVVIVFIAPSIVQMAVGTDPCAQNYSPSCFSAHPEYYQSTDAGFGWTTPSSRVAEAIGPLFLVAWPVALAGAVISVVALATGTARRRTAVAGLVIGSAVAVGQLLVELGLMFGSD